MDNLGEWLKPSVIWFAVGFILLLLEFANPGVIILFFGIGAWLVAILCLFLDLSINLQLIIFMLSSLIFLVSLRRWFKALFQGRDESDSPSEDVLSGFVGKKAVVTKEIKAKTAGKVEFRGSYWDAEADAAISEGTAVEIIDKKNITLIVKPL